MNACGLSRLGMLAVGLGIGIAMAATPGIASADSLDFQISIDGYDLLPATDNSATATSGAGDIAIAFGNGATASAAYGGSGEFAIADGNDAVATAMGGQNDFAEAIGSHTFAYAGYFAGSNDDSAISIGDYAMADAVNGSNDFALADTPASIVNSGGNFSPGVTGSDDVALVVNPSGTGDTLQVGQNGSHDLGAILFEGPTTNFGAAGGDYLYDILSPWGPEAGTFPSWLTDLLALF